jgi:hypothetical protein
VAILEKSNAHSTKRKYFHLGDFYKDLQMKMEHFSSSRPKPVPYLISSSKGNHGVFLGSLISSYPSRSNNLANRDEDEPSFKYGTPLQRWIDQPCGYPFKQDIQDDRNFGYSFQQDFLPPNNLHEFHFMIDYMSIYAHDYYLLNLSLLYYRIKHRGRYLDEVMNMWLHWLYDFT